MSTSRRAFLEAGLAAGAAPFSTPSAQPADRVDSSFDPWVEIHAGNLRHNVTEISRRVTSRPILAVIKNNGYGLGVVNAARLLEPMAGIGGFAVVKLHEACVLRDAGIRKPVLLMGPFDEANLEDAARKNIMPMVYTPLGRALDTVSARLQRPIALQFCVDTGIGRVGVPYREADSLIRDLARRKSVSVEGAMMTFTEDPVFDQEQLARFRTLCRALETDGINLGKKHAASSFALFEHPDAFLDMVRPGMAIYGVYSEKQFRSTGVMDLRPALSLKARVAYVKRLQKGESAGYNRAYVARDDVWVATLPVGHADGLPRATANHARVGIRGKMFPIVSTVSASHCIVEVGADPEVEIGDIATFFDWQEGSRPEDFGASCDASVYDLTMHVNPLIPRRILST